MKTEGQKHEGEKIWQTPILKELTVDQTKEDCSSGTLDLPIIIN